MISTKSKSNGKAQTPALTPKPSAPTPTESRLAGRKSIAQTHKAKSISWIHVHFSERRGYKRVHVGHKYNPGEHAVLCQRLREGTLGSGYFMQIEDPAAPSGSLQEVLHPQDVERINFDTLDEFLVSHATAESQETGVGIAAGGELAQ